LVLRENPKLFDTAIVVFERVNVPSRRVTEPAFVSCTA
jgi:hypothetical protein